MTHVTELIDTFEGEARRTLWLPVITLGYIFTLSGCTIDFVLAIISISGARFLSNVLQLDPDVELGNMQEFWSQVGLSDYSPKWRYYFLTLCTFIYIFAIPYGLLRLYTYFNHSNPILVGLSGIYWGMLIVIIVNP